MPARRNFQKIPIVKPNCIKKFLFAKIGVGGNFLNIINYPLADCGDSGKIRSHGTNLSFADYQH